MTQVILQVDKHQWYLGSTKYHFNQEIFSKVHRLVLLSNIIVFELLNTKKRNITSYCKILAPPMSDIGAITNGFGNVLK